VLQAHDTPVIVVGGGPVGLGMAIELDHQGVPVVVVEPRETISHARPRAKTMSARSMELFRRWRIADELRAAAPLPVAWSDEVCFCTTVTGTEVTRIGGCFGLDLVGSYLVAEAGQQVSQPVVEEVLRRVLSRRPGVTMLTGWRALGARQDASGVTVEVEDAAGQRRTLTAAYLVGADGPRSVVRAAMGVRYEGEAGGRPNVNVTFRSRDLGALIPHRPSIHYWVLNPSSPGVVGPLDLDGTWWAIATGTESVADNDEAAAIVRRLVGAEVNVEVLATDPWQARLLLADSYRVSRMFLVGDAAHQNPPWGGHGFNTGLGDAVNLGWKLGGVIRGWASPALLDSYESERRPVAQRTIEAAHDNMRVLSTDLSKEADLATAATRIQVSKDAEFHSLGLVLGYGYGPRSSDQSPSVPSYRPLVDLGNRLPHLWLTDTESLYDRLSVGFALIGPLDLAEPLLAAARRRGLPLAHVEPDDRLLGHLGHPLVLVRPDQHIAWFGSSSPEPDPILDAALHGFPRPRPRRTLP
jgi:2-polyprenyl-6-methoxyphenol hydroxylase-like FAD-dependent oxidoreductase